MRINTLRFIVIFFSLLLSTQKSFAKGNGSNINIQKLASANDNRIAEIPFKKSKFPLKKTNFAIVIASALNLRSSPIIKNNIIKVLPMRTHLITLSPKINGWVKVKIPNDINGWVYDKFIKRYQPKSLSLVNKKYNSNSFLSNLEASIIEYMEDIYSQNKLNKKDQLSLVIQDLSSGELLASIRPRKIIKSASTIKVPILHAYMLQRFKGRIKESPWHKKLIEEMIRYSRNSSTNSIIHLLGGTNNIQNILYDTKVYKDLILKQYFPVDGRAYLNKISARDLNQIFVNIWLRLILNSNSNDQKNKEISQEMLFLLGLPGHSWLKDRIKDGTCFSSEKSVNIWDKTGFVKGANGNAGIIELDSPYGKKAYSIVLFIERKNYETIKGDAKIWSDKVSFHMRRISEMTYAFFSYRYERYFNCGFSSLIRYIKIVHKTQKNIISS